MRKMGRKLGQIVTEETMNKILKKKCIICGKPVRRKAKYCCEYHRNKDYLQKKKIKN